jgi:hypothetical protein
LNAFVIGPSDLVAVKAVNPAFIRTLISAGSKHLMETSEPLTDRESIAVALTELSLQHLSISQWIIRSNNGKIGWINASDLVLLEKFKSNADILTEKDLNDPNFRELLKQSIEKDLDVITATSGLQSNAQFLREAIEQGSCLEAAPTDLKSAPSAAFLALPGAKEQVVATWEKLFISLHEPFATIHPAFSVDPSKLRSKSLKIAAEATKKSLFGYSIVDFWFSNRELDKPRMKLTPQNMSISQTNRILPFMLAESVLKKPIDDSTFVYVQERLQLPSDKSIEVLGERCREYDIPIDSKVFFLPDLQEDITVGLVVVETSPKALVYLVYRTLCVLCENVFQLDNDPGALLFSYCNAIEFLKNQFDEGDSIRSTAYQRKVKVKEAVDLVQPILWRFGEKFDDGFVHQQQSDDSPESPRSVHISPVTSARGGIDKDRAMLTTPTDGNGREKRLMTTDDDDKTIALSDHSRPPTTPASVARSEPASREPEPPEPRSRESEHSEPPSRDSEPAEEQRIPSEPVSREEVESIAPAPAGQSDEPESANPPPADATPEDQSPADEPPETLPAQDE